MRKVRWIAPFLLLIYSGGMLYADIFISREFARYFFTDIGQPYRLGYFAPADGFIGYGINTSLSLLMLSCAATFLLFCSVSNKKNLDDRSKFFLSQSIVLYYMAIDDRFMIHERFSDNFHVSSSWVFLALIMVYALIYARWFREEYFTFSMFKSLSYAALLFSLMIVVDEMVDGAIAGRLAIEDLAKVWSGYFLLRFSWLAAEQHSLAGAARSEPWVPDWLRSRLPRLLRSRLIAD